MEVFTPNLSRWTTEELVGEVIRRSAGDGGALQALQIVVIRARLAEGDRRFACGTQPELSATSEFSSVCGTTEMGLTDGEVSSVLTSAAHEVDRDALGAHAHDHTHRKHASEKLAAHDHHHVHLEDSKTDGEVNGHTHKRSHEKLPWEDRDLS